MVALLSLARADRVQVIDEAFHLMQTILADEQFHFSLAITRCSQIDFSRFRPRKVSFLQNAGATLFFHPNQRELVFTCSAAKNSASSDCGDRPWCDQKRDADVYNWKFRILVWILGVFGGGEQIPEGPALYQRRESIGFGEIRQIVSAHVPQSSKILLLIYYNHRNEEGKSDSPSVTSQSIYYFGRFLREELRFGYPFMGMLIVNDLHETVLQNSFRVLDRNESLSYNFGQTSITREADDFPATQLGNCEILQVSNRSHPNAILCYYILEDGVPDASVPKLVRGAL